MNGQPLGEQHFLFSDPIWLVSKLWSVVFILSTGGIALLQPTSLVNLSLPHLHPLLSVSSWEFKAFIRLPLVTQSLGICNFNISADSELFPFHLL